jgi:hypothetical protein
MEEYIMKKLLVIITSIVIIIALGINTSAATKTIEEGLANLNSKMEGVLTIAYNIGYWILLVKAFMDILANVMNKNLREVGKVILLYVSIYAALYILPFMFKLVENLF